jgi:hypothetical protein
MARAVLSQPPPGAAGTNILMLSNRGLACAQAGSEAVADAAALNLMKSLFEMITRGLLENIFLIKQGLMRYGWRITCAS